MLEDAKSIVKIELSYAAGDPELISHISRVIGRHGFVVVEMEVVTIESVQDNVDIALPMVYTRV